MDSTRYTLKQADWSGDTDIPNWGLPKVPILLLQAKNDTTRKISLRFTIVSRAGHRRSFTRIITPFEKSS